MTKKGLTADALNFLNRTHIEKSKKQRQESDSQSQTIKEDTVMSILSVSGLSSSDAAVESLVQPWSGLETSWTSKGGSKSDGNRTDKSSGSGKLSVTAAISGDFGKSDQEVGVKLLQQAHFKRSLAEASVPIITNPLKTKERGKH